MQNACESDQNDWMKHRQSVSSFLVNILVRIGIGAQTPRLQASRRSQDVKCPCVQSVAAAATSLALQSAEVSWRKAKKILMFRFWKRSSYCCCSFSFLFFLDFLIFFSFFVFFLASNSVIVFDLRDKILSKDLGFFTQQSLVIIISIQIRKGYFPSCTKK